MWPQGRDLVSTMPGYMCPKVKDICPFQLQGSEMSENISLKVGNLKLHIDVNNSNMEGTMSQIFLF